MYARSLDGRLQRSDAAAGKPKRCSVCGEVGHNRRGCPQAKLAENAVVDPAEDTSQPTQPAAHAAQAAKPRYCIFPQSLLLACDLNKYNSENGSLVNGRGSSTQGILSTRQKAPMECSVCGSPGHNRQTCPQRLNPLSAPAAASGRRSEKSSRFAGVTWQMRNRKWKAQCWDGKRVCLWANVLHSGNQGALRMVLHQVHCLWSPRDQSLVQGEVAWGHTIC